MTQQYTIAFKMLDVDGTGSIDQDELRDGLELIGKSVTDEELVNLLEGAGVDASDGLDFPSFVTLMVKTTKNSNEDGDKGDGDKMSGSVTTSSNDTGSGEKEEVTNGEEKSEPAGHSPAGGDLENGTKNEVEMSSINSSSEPLDIESTASTNGSTPGASRYAVVE